MKKKRIIVILIMAMLLVPATLFAENLIFATTQVPPFAFQENGEWLGTDVELIRIICEKEGIVPEFRDLPWKRGLMYVERGDVHAMFPLFRTEERIQFLYFPSEHIDTVKTIIISRKESNIKINSLDDLKDKPVGVVAGYSYGPKFDNYSELKQLSCNDMPEQAKILHRGRIEIAVVPDLPFGFICKQLGFQDSFETAYIISEDHNYVGFSKKGMGAKGKSLAEVFTRELRRLREEGIEKQIITKYIH